MLNVLNHFPKFELSYEIMTHKKVHNADILLAIPEGIKYYSWFTNYNGESVCFLLELNNKNAITNIKQINVSFDESLSLSLGTIFYGTCFKYNGVNCFCIEDVYYYKGKNNIYVSYLKKLELLRIVLKDELSQTILNNTFTVFGLPLIHTDLNQLLKEIQLLPYKVSKIKHRFFEKQYLRKIMTMNYFKPGNKSEDRNNDKKQIKKAIFNITADIEPDIYNLFSEKDEYVDVAFIPDYKTSVMMNKLFRNIKENDNLDALEESDDEEEFEDDRKDKYVYLDKTYKMNCEYNHKFKKWVPVSLV